MLPVETSTISGSIKTNRHKTHHTPNNQKMNEKIRPTKHKTTEGLPVKLELNENGQETEQALESKPLKR